VRTVVGLLALAACGRINFDPLGDSGTSHDCGVTLQSGDLVIDPASTSTIAPLSVPLARTLLITTMREAEPSPAYGNTACALVAAGVQCQRLMSGTDYAMSTGAITVHWTAVTFASGVNVQRGLTTINGVNQVTIDPVDLASSFVILGGAYMNTGVSWGTDEYIQGRLTDDHTIELTNLLGISAVSWQVITVAGASVQSGDFALTDADTTQQIPIAAVDLEHAFPLISYTYDSDVGPLGVRVGMASPYIGAPDMLQIARAGTGAPLAGTWQVITVPYLVHAGAASVIGGMTSYTFGLPLDPNTTVAFGTLMSVLGPSGGQGYLSTASPVADMVGEATFTMTTGAGGLTIERGTALSDAAVTFATLDFATCP